MKIRPARWRWVSENGKSGLRPRPQGAGDAGFDASERDVITAQVPTRVLLEAARAMTEPEPPADLGLYRALEREANVVEQPPRSSRHSPAPPLAAEFGLEHLLEAEGKPARSWSLWLRAHGLWVAVAVMLLWLITSFAARWLATPWP
jgi:hypothetical protein